MRTQDPAAPDGASRQGFAPGDQGRIFVGREREMEILLAGLRDAMSGRGAFFLLGGEPGIGKTKLADEFAVRAEAEGAFVLWGRCWEAGGAPAYWPWIQSVRGLLRTLDAQSLGEKLAGGGSDLAQILPELRERIPDLPEPPRASPEVARFRLFDAITGFLVGASEERPLLLILEDLHVADASSILLLRFVAGEVGASRLLVLGTYRDVELTRDHQLAAALPEIARGPGTTRLHLRGLNRTDVSLFIEKIAGRTPSEDIVHTIHDDTLGNPLFVGEMVRLLASEGGIQKGLGARPWPIPEGVREVIGRRLDRLPEDCKEILVLASVMGRDFTVEGLERITGRSAEDLLGSVHDAVLAGIIGEVRHAPGTFRFAHSLMRDALYEDLLLADRVRLHRAVGEALEAMYARDPQPHLAELAHHFFEAAPAGNIRKAVDYASAAGKRAVALLAYEEAVRLFRMALHTLRESPDEERRGEVLLLLGDAEGRSGDTPASKETFLEAAGIATRLGLPELLARAAFGYAGRFPWLRAGVDRQVIPLLKQALDALGGQDNELSVLLMSRLAGALRDEPSMEPRASLSRHAVEMARRLDDPETLTYALLGHWSATLLGPDGLDGQHEVAEELERVTAQIGDRERLMDACWVRFIAFMTRGRVWEARAQRDQMDRLALELRQPSQRWYVGVITTVLALQDGRFQEAEHLLEETLEAGRRAQAWDADAAHLFARFILRREQGRVGELESDLRRAPMRYPGYRSIHCMLLSALCELGRHDEARGLLDQLAVDDFAAFPKDNEWLFALTLLAECAVALGDGERAGVLYDQLGPYRELVALAASEVSIGPVSRPLGLLAGLLGRRDEAVRHFEDAIGRAQRMSARPWVAHSQYELARLLAESRSPQERERAVELATSALEVAFDVGMIALEDRLTGLLARLGARPRRRPSEGSANATGVRKATGLTARENEVAGLVAEGLSNRQIAERFFVSERTAETHVQNILMKLGFTSRTQVAGWALRKGDPVEGT